MSIRTKKGPAATTAAGPYHGGSNQFCAELNSLNTQTEPPWFR